MGKIKVSIITVCYNSEKTIERTISSVLDQTYDKIEYIIVDGASTDRTIEIINRFRGEFGDRLKFISEKDDGIYYAMNKGIELATGELIGIINSDDWYEKDAVEKIVEVYEKNSDNRYAVYYGKTGTVRDGIVCEVNMSDHDELEDNMISHPSCFVTKDTYTDKGKFDTKYISVADYDFMLRLKRSGDVNFIPVREHIANFSLGGMCSTSAAYIDLLKLKMNYGKISTIRGRIEIAKAKLAETMIKHGLKPIQLRKK